MQKKNHLSPNQLKSRRKKKRKDLLFLIFTGSIIITTVFYFNYNQTTIDVPDNIPKLYIKSQHRIKRTAYSDCVIILDSDTILSEIKIRGVFNSYLDKKGYRLRLYEQYSLLKMRKDDDWQLFAMYLDYPHMRVKLAFDLWQTLEPTNPTAILPDSEYVNVYLNEEYIGLFLLAERNDKKLFNLDDPQNSFDSSLIFQLKTHSYFREYDELVWQQDLPKSDEDDYTFMNIILSDLISFVNDSTDEEFFDPANGIYTIFDWQNLIDFYVFNYFILHVDFWYKNYYIIRDSSPSKFYLIPWDFDGSFGQWGDIKYESEFECEYYAREGNELFNRLLNNEKFRLACRNRWFELREDLWSEDSIMDMVFDMYEEIKDSIKISMSLYDLDDKTDEYVKYLFQWIPERIDFCDSYFSNI